MKNSLVVFLFSFLIAEVSRAQSVFIAADGDVSFYSEAPIENIQAHCKSPNSILNFGTHEIAFLVPIRGFKFAKALMQEHFNEKYMESDKYPNATFKGKINEAIDFTRNGTYNVSATGKMNIHGVEREMTQHGTLTIKDKAVNLTCAFPVAVKEYNITIPKLLFENIADTVSVKLNINYQPYKK